MNIDHKLQKAVIEALDYDPDIDCGHIGVTVRDQIVTLTGHVSSNAEKRAAEIVAGRVDGVRAVIDDVLVELPGRSRTADEVIAENCYERLAEERSVPYERVHVSVCDGIVTVHGDVDNDYQREAAKAAIADLDGVRSLIDELAIKPPVNAEAVRARIRQMLAPISAINANRIEVKTEGSHVTLHGTVNSWHERGLAESAVWSVPGVTGLSDLIVVDA
ncbi:MAG TPA: BON domain-containing protein [Devosiaceae bacterium]|nr:BON domain-containing protein [Devosiaceae bacterium]